jgi:general secretion pathway protein B
MSYILEALRRADAQRALGQSPGLHAQSPAVPAAADDAAGPPRRTRWALGATGIAVLVALAVWAGWRAAPPTVSAPVPATAAQAAPAAVAPAAPASVVAEPAARVAPAAPSLASLPPLPPPAVAAPPARPAPPPANAAASSADAAGAVTALSELPPAQRALLPPLVVGGAVDSPQPSARLLVLDGRVLREGETIARDLVLERIGPRQAVLRWREQRVRLDF